MKLKNVNRKLALTRGDSQAEKSVRDESHAVDATSYQALAKSMLDGAVTITTNGIIIQSNLSFAELMETPFEQLIGKSFFTFVGIGWNQRFFDFLHGSVEQSRSAEISLTTRTGKEVSALLTCNAFSLEGEPRLSLTVSDINSRKKMEDALVRSQQRLETVAGLHSNAVWEWDTETKEIWRSEGFASLLGYPDNALETTPVWWNHAIHPQDRSPVISALERLVKTGNGTLKQTYRIRKFDGSYAEVVDRAVAIRDHRANTLRVIGSIVDVTDQNKERAAKQELSKRILHAQEQERQRVARDLHDGVSQLLASSNYRLHHVHNQMSKQDKAMAQKISEARELVEKAHKEIQLISRNLRPSELDDLGLHAAFRTLCSEFQKRTGIKTTLKNGDFKSLAQEVELTLYRIAQEALNNVEKHAAAKHVRISLKRTADAINLTIRDDGKGLDFNHVKKSAERGCGLENMRERAACFSGTFTINTASLRGAEIVVSIPTV